MQYVDRTTLNQDQCSGESSSWSYTVDNKIASITGGNVEGTINTDATEIMWNNGYTYQKIGKNEICFHRGIFTCAFN